MSDEKSNDLDAFLDQESKDAVDDDASSLLDGVENEDNNQLISEEEDTLLADELTNEQQSSLGETDISNMVEEANESLITGNPDPFSTEDFERLNTSLVNIESKIDNDKSRLKKLDLLVRDYAVQITKDHNRVQDKQFEELRKYFSEEQMVELTFRITLCTFFNKFNDVMQLEMEESKLLYLKQ